MEKKDEKELSAVLSGQKCNGEKKKKIIDLKKPQQQLSFVPKCSEGNNHYCGVFNGFGKYSRGADLPFLGLLQ